MRAAAAALCDLSRNVALGRAARAAPAGPSPARKARSETRTMLDELRALPAASVRGGPPRRRRSRAGRQAGKPRADARGIISGLDEGADDAVHDVVHLEDVQAGAAQAVALLFATRASRSAALSSGLPLSEQLQELETGRRHTEQRGELCVAVERRQIFTVRRVASPKSSRRQRYESSCRNPSPAELAGQIQVGGVVPACVHWRGASWYEGLRVACPSRLRGGKPRRPGPLKTWSKGAAELAGSSPTP